MGLFHLYYIINCISVLLNIIMFLQLNSLKKFLWLLLKLNKNSKFIKLLKRLNKYLKLFN